MRGRKSDSTFRHSKSLGAAETDVVSPALMRFAPARAYAIRPYVDGANINAMCVICVGNSGQDGGPAALIGKIG